MSKRILPADIEAERALLGACILDVQAAETAVELLEPSDFFAMRHAEIFAAITAQVRLGDGRVDIVRLASVLDGDNIAAYLIELQNDTPAISNAPHYAETILAHSLRRKAVHIADRVSREAMDCVVDAGDVAEHARQWFADLDMPTRIGHPDADVAQFIDGTDLTYDWLVPDFLERRDRMLVTAGEGVGKSELNMQIAVQVAAGIHPWTGADIVPRNVLVVDLENGDKQAARRFRRLTKQAGSKLDPARLRLNIKPEGLNLATRTDRRWLLERCLANRAELLVIGPLYKMESGVAARGDVGGQDAARSVAMALDEIRMRTGVAMLLETHAPHATGMGRDLRPFGSSVWLRWPEFGIGLRRNMPDSDRVYDVEHWRGPRDVRVWPEQLIKGGRWPWTAVMPAGTFRSPA